MRHFLTFLLAPILLFCTAVPPESAAPDYLITGISLTCPGCAAPLQLTDQQAMGQILQYLRQVPLHGKADNDSIDPELPLYTFRLTHATGRITEYRQRGAEYLSKNGSPWYHIDPEDGGFLIAFFNNTLYNE